jgi:hypothetical protein
MPRKGKPMMIGGGTCAFGVPLVIVVILIVAGLMAL